MDESKKKYYAYIIKCKKTGKYYTGISNNYLRRIEQHNQENQGNTKHTKKLGPFKIIHLEEHETRQEARSREKFWKSGIGRGIRNKYFV